MYENKAGKKGLKQWVKIRIIYIMIVYVARVKASINGNSIRNTLTDCIHIHANTSQRWLKSDYKAFPLMSPYSMRLNLHTRKLSKKADTTQLLFTATMKTPPSAGVGNVESHGLTLHTARERGNKRCQEIPPIGRQALST